VLSVCVYLPGIENSYILNLSKYLETLVSMSLLMLNEIISSLSRFISNENQISN